MAFCSSCLLNLKRCWSNQVKDDVSKAFPLLICIDLETESLKTFKNTHIYNFLLHSTNLHCQINMHLRKTGKLDVLVSQFWNQAEARCSCLITSIPVVQLNYQLPINCIPIALHWKKNSTHSRTIHLGFMSYPKLSPCKEIYNGFDQVRWVEYEK